MCTRYVGKIMKFRLLSLEYLHEIPVQEKREQQKQWWKYHRSRGDEKQVAIGTGLFFSTVLVFSWSANMAASFSITSSEGFTVVGVIRF